MLTNDPTAPLFAEDRPGDDVALFAKMIEEEALALLDILPEAIARQWEASPVPRPREDTTERSVGDQHSDPTADVALDPRRLAIRSTIFKSRQVLHDAATAIRGVRLAMERTVEWYDGEKR